MSPSVSKEEPQDKGQELQDQMEGEEEEEIGGGGGGERGEGRGVATLLQENVTALNLTIIGVPHLTLLGVSKYSHQLREPQSGSA